MPAPADPELIAEAVRMVAEGATYSSAGRAVGLSWMTVRTWCLREGVQSPETRPDFVLRANEGPLERFWEDSRLPGPSPRNSPGNAGNPRRRRNGGRPALFVGFTEDRLPRPDLPVGAVIDGVALETAMSRWRTRVATADATAVLERHVRSSWDASTR